ncbi:MAG: RNA ligase [Streptosporangiaceae bacterium]
MYPHLSELFDPDALRRAVSEGYVREQVHPALPYKIIGYTEKAQFERAWDEVTRQCRGLVVDADERVLARPYAKFFNYSEHPEGTFDLGARVIVADKMDGSLGILVPTPGGHEIATRGSFASDQARHATRVWQERYAATTEVVPGITYLFEIIYPANRIVVDYGSLDDLVLLGGVEICTGRPVAASELSWAGPTAATFDYPTLGEALAAPAREGAEGYVLRFPDHGHVMIKIKQDDYVALHRIITGLNARLVWEGLTGGRTVAEICDGLPDEFHDWVRGVAAGLTGRRDAILAEARAEHRRIVEALPQGWTRRDYAEVAGRSARRGWLFLLLDDRDPGARVWQTLRPSGDERPVNVPEDNA